MKVLGEEEHTKEKPESPATDKSNNDQQKNNNNWNNQRNSGWNNMPPRNNRWNNNQPYRNNGLIFGDNLNNSFLNYSTLKKKKREIMSCLLK